MKALRPVVWLLVALPASLAGCIGDGGGEALTGASLVPPAGLDDVVTLPPAVRMAEDAAGDAEPASARAHVDLACRTGRFDVPFAGANVTFPEAACGPAGAAPQPVPAAPELDVLGITFQETPSYIIVDLELAKVDPTFAAILAKDGSVLNYDLCWGYGNQTCGYPQWPEDLWVTIQRVNGRIEAIPRIWVEERGCLGACVWPIAMDLIGGEPGVIRHYVPRALLHDAAPGARLAGAGIALYHSSTGGVRPDTRVAGLGTDACCFAPALADFAAGDPEFHFTLAPARSTTIDPPPRHWLDTDEDPMRGEETQVDVTGILVSDTAASITVAVEVARLPEEPRDHEVRLRMGLDTGPGLLAGYRFQGGQMARTAARCLDVTCSRQTDTPVDVVLEAGSPGRILFTFDRKDIGAPRAGALLTYAVVTLEVPDPRVGPNGEEVGDGKQVDRLLRDSTIAPPGLRLTAAVVREDLPAGAEGTVVEDELYDTRSINALEQNGQSLTGGGAGGYDLSYLAAAPVTTGTVRLVVGLRDFRSVEIPPGYDAIVYAVALETRDGAFMAYFYQPDSGPGAFYCAQDSLVLVPPADRNPVVVAPTSIVGTVLLGRAQAGRSGEAPAPGSVTFLVPNACLGGLGEGPVRVERMGAAVLAVREVGVEAGVGRTALADDMLSEQAFTMDATVPDAPVTFLQAPFGVESFWDMSGAALALVTVLFTATVFYRRRRMLRLYLTEIRRIQDELARDPVSRARALVALRSRLHRDLERHRISDNHYPIVLDRLRSRLTSARLTSIGEAFYALPPPLAMRLERLLDDGHLSEEECRVVEPLLQGVRLSGASRDTVLASLRTWVLEDAADVRG